MGTSEGSFIWKRLTEFLEQIKNLIFKVGDMSVCDQYKVMEKNLTQKPNREEGAWGLVPEGSELDQVMSG